MFRMAFLISLFFVCEQMVAGPATYYVSTDEISFSRSSAESGAPLVTVEFDHLKAKKIKLFARLYSQGTSGQIFEYFYKKQGPLIKIGIFPEFFYDNESAVYFSLQKDGRRILKTTYRLEKFKFIELDQIILGDENE
ncbi:MAG: hypothetical protein K9K67_15240 [Bacteriovoracaceae bacterium]|nr:hypothetical protein [Bacteriovoracaceae bacterium]